jgi:uncharacterized protein (TIGR03089 family)
MPVRRDTVVSALARGLDDDPGRPLVTFYDGASGERIELSVTTFDNWVAKIANLFSDELLAEPGDGVRVSLPVHWQSSVTLVGAWTAGLRVLVGNAGSDAVASVIGPAGLSNAVGVDGQAIACSLRPLGGPFTTPLPDGWLDFSLVVPSQPDIVVTPVDVEPEHIALVAPDGELTHRDLLDRALETAKTLRLSPGDRLLTDANPCDPQGMHTALLAPLVTGGSIVLVTNCDAPAVSAIARQERATVTARAAP